MKKFIVLTLFKEMFEPFVNTSIIKRAIDKKVVEISVLDIRNFTEDKHNRVDFSPFGGGSGMIMSCIPLSKAIDFSVATLKEESSKEIKIVYLSPRGKILNYNISNTISKDDYNYIFICGHYEGIDERILEEYNIEEISIGDYVLTGGELACQVLMDSVIRLIPGAIKSESLNEESHTNGLLEYPQYTKPANFRGRVVPDVLLSGHHKNIEEYRKGEALRITKKYRPDLFNKYIETKKAKD